MKKIIISLLISVFVLGSVAIGLALAQDQTLNDCCKASYGFKIGATTITKNTYYGANGGSCVIGTTVITPTAIDEWGMVCLLSTIYTVTNWIFYIMGILAVLMVVYGGLIYITAAGDPSAAGKGKTILIYSMIGLAIALVAKLIPSLVRFIVGM